MFASSTNPIVSTQKLYSAAVILRPRPEKVALGLWVSLLVLGVAACDLPRRGGSSEPEIPVSSPATRGGDPFLESPEVIEILTLQNARRGDGIARFLTHADPGIRARAAFALASVQDPQTRAALETRLRTDPVAAVRADAAFALGQLELPDGGEGLAAALAQETDPEVRFRLIEAIGKQGSGARIPLLLEGIRDEEVGGTEAPLRYLAVAQIALREGSELTPQLLEVFLGGVASDDLQTREAAAWIFGRNPSRDLFVDSTVLTGLRARLDALDRGDLAAASLLLALGRVGDADDRERIVGWLREATDWRIRTNAARALVAPPLLEGPGTREALWEAIVSDPSEHVSEAAATTFVQTFRIPQEWLGQIDRWVMEGDPARWRAKIPLLAVIIEDIDVARAVLWAERMLRRDPVAVTYVVQRLALSRAPVVKAFLFEMASHPDPVVSGAAVEGLASLWSGSSDQELSRFATEFIAQVRDGGPRGAVAAARVLSELEFYPFGAIPALIEAYEVRRERGPIPVLEAILLTLGNIGEPDAVALVVEALGDDRPRIRKAAGDALWALTGSRTQGLNLPDPERLLDVRELQTLGLTPRLKLETSKGTIWIRLVPDQAPVTVQAIAELANAGRYDGVPFHRVLGNFIAQTGDVALGNGAGGPDFSLRSEFTAIPFIRGVVGMASTGKDTEGSQFFLLHSPQPHLDGQYTAFGWIEEGASVLDAILLGDRILSARVEAYDEAYEEGESNDEVLEDPAGDLRELGAS
jgi:cyclophilin family peptidyl-prolyl cis-trans isomerase/HEAT repeat protein